jgi:hypothetical protein
MSGIVKFVKPTIELIEVIAADMRQADVDEVWASHHHTPIQALSDGWKVSDFSVIVTVNDDPCVMFGLVIRDILSGTGVPWLLGTDNALKYKRQFLIQTQPVINEMLTICTRLVNYVHIDNKVSIRWLKWIGFTIDEPLPYGCDNELFHKFYIERSD